MVDQNLINEIKEMREKGASQPSDALKIFEFAKQLAEESEDLKEELEDIDTTVVQLIITDINYKYWVKMGDGTVDYGEGEGDDPSVTMSATGATWTGMSSGEIDSTSAYMSGDLVIDGNLQDAIAFGEIQSIAMEEGAHYFE
ncbi:MAG: SCP2 sterol-binding domain-containing protein [Candidatus Lokiarchaeota archaeon]|nr:SCP2 sterol-binding domain-containing protein [Candidatus Lokiarchaeota archaeon]